MSKRKSLTSLNDEELKILIFVIYDALAEAEKEIATNFREYFTTKSFYYLCQQVIDTYLYNRFPNHKQAFKTIEEVHKMTLNDLKGLKK